MESVRQAQSALALAEMAGEEGESTKSLEELRSALASASAEDAPEATNALAAALFSAGERDEAVGLLLGVIRADPRGAGAGEGVPGAARDLLLKFADAVGGTDGVRIRKRLANTLF